MSADSPCVRICNVDARADICIGCFRTLDEISCWTRYSEGERTAINEKLPARRAQFEAATGWKRLLCRRCGAEFGCGAQDPTRPCWCTGYPPVAPSDSTMSCLCPGCLSEVPPG